MSSGSINPNSGLVQLCIIVMICLIPTGSYFGMDSPAPFEKNLKMSVTTNEEPDPKVCPNGFDESVPECSSSMKHGEYMFLWSIYSAPNILLCFFSGYLIDSVVGRRKGSLIFAGIVTLGATIVAYGAYTDSLYMMYVGRFVFGCGSESLALCEYAYNVHWFDQQKLQAEPKYKPKIGLSLMFGIAISISRGATAAAFQVIGRSYRAFAGVNNEGTEQAVADAVKYNFEHAHFENHTDLDTDITILNYSAEACGKTFGIAALYAGFCFCVALGLGSLDIRCSRWRKEHKLTNEEMRLQNIDGAANDIVENDDEDDDDDDDDDTAGGMITWADIKSLPINGWLVFIICVCFYSTIFPFATQAVEFFRNYRGIDDADLARTYSSLILVLSGFGLAPAMGMLIDVYRYNTVWLGGGIGCAGIGHFLLAYTEFSVFATVIIMGIGYSAVAASLWPLLSYNVPKRISGTSYGLMQSIQLGGLMLMYEVSGKIIDSHPGDQINAGYKIIENIYILLNIIAIICTVMLARKTGVHGGAVDTRSK